MKVVICSCARCTAAGNEFLLDSVEEVKADLLKAYSFDKIDRKPEIEVEFTNIMDDIEDPDNSAPLAKVDDTYLEKVMPEELMEHIFNAHSPIEEAN